jgi:nitrite reductase/ring-hydroxylating ferredoxin subunit
MEFKTLKRSIFQRLFGISATQLPKDKGCWTYSNGKVVVDLDRAPELSEPGGAIRLEGKSLPDRVLLIHGEDGNYHAFRNRCGHMGRRLDPVPETQTVQCCSVSKSTYDYDGNILFGPAKKLVGGLAVLSENDKVIITL